MLCQSDQQEEQARAPANPRRGGTSPPGLGGQWAGAEVAAEGAGSVAGREREAVEGARRAAVGALLGDRRPVLLVGGHQNRTPAAQARSRARFWARVSAWWNRS
jgi:hypothetical protein